MKNQAIESSKTLSQDQFWLQFLNYAESGIQDTAGRKQLPGGALATVLGWEFLTPEDDRLSDEQLLRETLDFVKGDNDFKRARRAFLDWQQKFLKDGTTDKESIDRATEEMRELLEAAKTSMNRLAIRKTVRNAFRVAPGVIGLTLAAMGIPGGIAAAAGGAFLSFGSIAVDEWFLKSAEEGKPAQTAFVHQVNRSLVGKEFLVSREIFGNDRWVTTVTNHSVVTGSGRLNSFSEYLSIFFL